MQRWTDNQQVKAAPQDAQVVVETCKTSEGVREIYVNTSVT